MAHSLHQRMRMAVDLLLGMRLIPVREALAPKGFSEETLKRGWSLLERVGLTLAAGNAPILGEHGEAIAVFEKEWFPIVRSVFKRRPELVARLLGRLRVEGRREATYLVPPFLLALRELEASELEQDREAFQHLQARGLTEEVIRAAEAHVRGFLQLDGPISYGSLPAIEEQAVAELWDFYLEWSGICRQLIKNKNWLRSLGLTAERRGRRKPSNDVSVSVLASAPGPRLSAPRENEAGSRDSRSNSALSAGRGSDPPPPSVANSAAIANFVISPGSRNFRSWSYRRRSA